MSITSDLRSYADTAVNQGKQALDNAQAQLNDVTGQANELFGKTRGNVSDIAEKATDAVNDLRVSAEKAVNFDALVAAVEPYVSQIKGYTASVSERAESLLAEAKKDKRVAQLLDAAGVVVDQVQERVVKPVQSLTGLGGKPAAKPTAAPSTASTASAARKPAAKPAAKPRAAKPAAKPAARKSTARTSTKTTKA